MQNNLDTTWYKEQFSSCLNQVYEKIYNLMQKCLMNLAFNRGNMKFFQNSKILPFTVKCSLTADKNMATS